MGEALYIVTEREIPDFDAFVNGKALSKSEPKLAALAKQLEVTPLLDFCSITRVDAAAFMEAEGIGAGDIELPPTTWFDADAGLASVNALDEYIANVPDAIPNFNLVRSDLAEFQSVLSRLKVEGVRWHLAVDY